MPGTTAKSACLAIFDEHQPTALILIAEAIMASLFGALGTQAYRELRLPELPTVDWNWALNRSDPMVPFSEIQRLYNISRQDALRDNALNAGPVNVMLRKTDKGGRKYGFIISQLRFTIPAECGREWELDSSPFVNVKFEISPTIAEKRFATLAKASDEGSRLSIIVSKFVNGQKQEIWLERNSALAIREANSLFDWLEGRIKDPATHEWPADRVRFIGPMVQSLGQVSTGTGQEPKKRKRKVHEDDKANNAKRSRQVINDDEEADKENAEKDNECEESEEPEEKEDEFAEFWTPQDERDYQRHLYQTYERPNHLYLQRQGVWSSYFRGRSLAESGLPELYR